MKTNDEIENYKISSIKNYRANCKCKVDWNLREAGYYLSKCPCKKSILFDCRLYKYNIPIRFWSKTGKDIHQSNYVYEKVVKTYCKNLNKMLRDGLGLFLTGDNGTGKTLLMCIIAKYIAYKTNYSVYYTTMPLLIKDYFTTIGFDDYSKDKKVLLDQHVLNVDFLLLDELGKENITPTTRTYIESVLRYRHDNKLPTIIASNLNLSDLSPNGSDGLYGATIVSIINGSCEVCITDPGDYRQVSYDKIANAIYNQQQGPAKEIEF